MKDDLLEDGYMWTALWKLMLVLFYQIKEGFFFFFFFLKG